jgi:hypothetical protein
MSITNDYKFPLTEEFLRKELDAGKKKLDEYPDEEITVNLAEYDDLNWDDINGLLETWKEEQVIPVEGNTLEIHFAMGNEDLCPDITICYNLPEEDNDKPDACKDCGAKPTWIAAFERWSVVDDLCEECYAEDDAKSANSSTYGGGCRRICRFCKEECSCWNYNSDHEVVCENCSGS